MVRGRARSPGGRAPRGRSPRGRSSTIGRPAPTDVARSRAEAASSPRNPSSIVPSSQDRRRRDVRVRREPGARGLERLALGKQADPQHRAEAEPSLDVGDASLGQDLAAIDDRDARAQLLELGQDVAADQDRLAQRPKLAEQLAQLDPGPRVETRMPARRAGAPAGRGRARGPGTAAAPCRATASGRSRRACPPRSTSSSRSSIIRRRPAAGSP